MQLSSKHQDEPNHLAAAWHCAAAQHSGALATDAHRNHSALNVLPVPGPLYHMLSTATLSVHHHANTRQQAHHRPWQHGLLSDPCHLHNPLG
jgi:hypothetical protein